MRFANWRNETAVWLRRDVVLAVHEQLLALFGGAVGVRDVGLLESALARPENQFAYDHTSVTIFDLAAAYAFGLAKNHPFVDGNERIALTAAVMFLELNGYRVEAGEADVVLHTLALAAGEQKERDYAAWLNAHSKQRRRRPD